MWQRILRIVATFENVFSIYRYSNDYLLTAFVTHTNSVLFIKAMSSQVLERESTNPRMELDHGGCSVKLPASAP